MPDVEKAIATQLANIQTKTGKTLVQLGAIAKKSGLTKHGEIRAMFQRELGLGYGDANTLALILRKAEEDKAAPAAANDPAAIVDGFYADAKAGLRPIHDKLMSAIEKFGPFEIAPKKNYLSLRRKKQFAMIGPATNSRVDVGLNMKDVAATERLIAMPAGGMCQYTVKVTAVKQVDKELLAWIKRAYDSAG